MDGRDDTALRDVAGAFAAAQQHGVEAILCGQRGRPLMAAGRGDRDAAGKDALLVGDVDHPVDEGAQENALADLQDFDRPGAEGGAWGAIDGAARQRGARQDCHRSGAP